MAMHVNMHVGVVSLHTPVMQAWDSEEPTSCQLFKPALFKAHTGAVPLVVGRESLLNIPRVWQLVCPTSSVYKNNLTPIQFVSVITNAFPLQKLINE